MKSIICSQIPKTTINPPEIMHFHQIPLRFISMEYSNLIKFFRDEK